MSEATTDASSISLHNTVKRLSTSSTAKRIGLLNELKQKELEGNEQIQAVVDGIFSTLHLYSDRASELAVENLLQTIFSKYSTNEYLIKYFLTLFKRQVNSLSKTPQTSHFHPRLVLLKWSFILIANTLDTIAKDGAVLSLLIGSQSPLLSTIALASAKSRASTFQAFLQLLQKKPVFDHYIGYLSDLDPSLNHLTLAGLLTIYAVKNEAVLAKHKAKLLEWYVKGLLTSTMQLGAFPLDLFDSFVGILDQNDLANTVLPALGRALKRNPEVALQVALALFPAIKGDLSNYARTTLLPALSEHFVATNDVVRVASVRALSLVVSRVADPTVFVGLAEDLAKTFTANLQPTQKVGVLTSIEALLKGAKVSDEAMEQAAGKVVPVLTPIVEKEGNEESKTKGLRVLGGWIGYQTKLAEPVVKLIATTLKADKEPIRSAATDAAVSALARADKQKILQIAPWVDQLVTIVKNAKSPKAAEIGSPVAALRALVRLATIDSAINDKLTADKTFWANAIGANSVLFSEVFLGRLGAREAIALNEVVDSVVQFAYNKPKVLDADGRAGVVGLLVRLLSHPANEVQRVTHATVEKLHGSIPTLADDMVVAVTAYLKALSTPSTPAVVPPAEGVLASTIRGCITPALSVDLYPTVALIAHHPFVAHNCWRSQVAGVLKKREGVNVLENKDIVISILKFVLGTEGLLSTNGLYQQAARAAAAGLVKDTTSVLPTFVQLFRDVVEPSALQALTADDIATYHTPADQLYKQVKSDEYVPKEKVAKKPVNQPTKQIKKRGDTSMYSQADEKWEAELRNKLDKKKQEEEAAKAAANAPKWTKEELKQLEEEVTIRAHVASLVLRFTNSLQAITEMALKNREAMHEHLGAFIRMLLPIVASELTTKDTLVPLETLGTCLQPRELCALRAPIAYLILHTHGPNPLPETELTAPLHKVINGLHALTVPFSSSASESQVRQEPLPSPSFAFVFPLLRTALEKSYSFILQEAALDIVEVHVIPGPPYPRGEMILVLSNVVAASPRLETRAKVSMQTLGGGLRQSDLEAVMQAVKHPEAAVRAAVIAALQRMPAIKSSSLPPIDIVSAGLWFIIHDPDQNNAAAGNALWKLYNNKLDDEYLTLLQPELQHPSNEVRRIVGKAIAGGFGLYPSSIPSALQRLFGLVNNAIPPFEGAPDRPKNIWLRAGVASTLGAAASALADEESVKTVFNWLVEIGLGDTDVTVVQEMTQAGVDILNKQGSTHHAVLLPIFEDFLNQPDMATLRQDQIREAVVIFLGTLAKHIDPTSPRVATILKRLVDALPTPSELVQSSVSKCLAQLMPSIKSQAPQLVDTLLQKVKSGRDYASLRGAAFGLAGAVKGLGISALKQYDIMQKLTVFVEDKKSASTRQGALFSFECLSNTLGRLFEPYVIQILPKLLVCYGDNSPDVRLATGETARAIMGQLSGHGVKLVLPALIKALEDRSWRTKEGSIELLGAMAFCAPKQLSGCLPTIVPKLTSVLLDTHENVQKAARAALAQVGSVIRNPEIQIHVPEILNAINEPDEYASNILDALLNTNFVHSIDAASLSLLVPVLELGLKERSAETKRKAAQIVGNMCSLTDPKELVPYMENLLPHIKNSLQDPIPDVRATSSRALGSLVSGMGEEQFTTLVSWLLDTMRSEAGSVERGGAAQGLAEVLAALGPERLQALLPEFISNVRSSKPHVREGAMYIFCFLSISMPRYFQVHLGRVLPCVLNGLADDSELVREVSLRAGSNIVGAYFNSASDTLLPALEEGLFSDNWRVRQSSVQLLGDLIAKLNGEERGRGANAGGEEGEEEEEPVAGSTKDVLYALGKEKVNSILAALYMIRFDVNSTVRQRAMWVWKGSVSNTPRTLREILPELMSSIIGGLGSPNMDKRHVASRTLGDIVLKLGDRILPEIIPMLERGLQSPDGERRQGVCLGLSEVISAAYKQNLGSFLPGTIPAVRKALCDPLSEVREAAAEAFDQLYEAIGNRVIDDIIPPLLASLRKDPLILDALQQILIVRASVVLPFLIPKLIAPPLTVHNIQALSSIASVAGAALYSRLPAMLPTLIEASAGSPEIKTATEQILQAVQEDGLHILIPELLRAISHDEPTMRVAAADLLGAFFRDTQTSLETYTHNAIVALFRLFNDKDTTVLTSVWTAMVELTKTIKKDNLSYIGSVAEGIRIVSNELRGDDPVLPGFCLPKGLQPVLPLLLNGLMFGTPEQREQSATVLGQTIQLTSSDALRPFVVQIAGPLIRVIGDRFPWQVKAAILQTLSLLIIKGSADVKRFLPQLQTTFIKALHDPTRAVRNHAAEALGKLMGLSPRVDPLVNELLSNVLSTEGGVQEGMLRALYSVLAKSGNVVDAAILNKVSTALLDLLDADDEGIRTLVAKVLGTYAQFAPEESVDSFLSTHVLADAAVGPNARHGRGLTLAYAARSRPQVMAKHIKAITSRLTKDAKDDKQNTRQSAADAVGRVLIAAPTCAGELLPIAAQLVNDTIADVAIRALTGVKNFAKAQPDTSRKYLNLLVPPAMNRLKDRMNLPLKLASERALLHLLQIFKNADVLTSYSSSIDAATSKSLNDYVKRVISKLSEHSESEKEDEDEAKDGEN